HADDFIVDFRVQHLWDETGAEALELVGTGLATREDGRGIRLDRDDFHGGLARFQDFADARDRSAGADARDDDVNLAVGITPDLFRRRFPVDGRIRRIGELLEDDGAGNL